MKTRPTLSDALKKLRDGDYGNPTLQSTTEWHKARHEIDEMVFGDILTVTKGDEVQAALLYIDYLAATLGNMLFYTGDKVMDKFNKDLARHESKFTVTLAWGKPVE